MTNAHWYKLTIDLIHSIASNPFGYTYMTSGIQEFTVQDLDPIL